MGTRKLHLGRDRLQRVVPHVGHLVATQRTAGQAHLPTAVRTDAVAGGAQVDRSVHRLGTPGTLELADDAVVVVQRDAELAIVVHQRVVLVGGSVIRWGRGDGRRRSGLDVFGADRYEGTFGGSDGG